jgi:hypothetical protein
MRILQVKWRRFYKAGYELRNQLVTHDGGDHAIWLTSAYNVHGDYIGDAPTAHYLCVKRGIAPILRTPKSNVCSIGYCTRNGKWYGWSHRAICGFGIGSEVKKGSCTSDSLPVGFTAIDIEDAKRMAEAFAASVS